MNFSDIPSHENVKRQLRDMVADGRVPHALLLHGPAGTGKFMLARTFAQYLHCEHPRKVLAGQILRECGCGHEFARSG
ncbi:MAG: ATP-binding protein, partial [Duncaniella sp.]|nr:ATP-binding protein [Duncaniella sp.]